MRYMLGCGAVALAAAILLVACGGQEAPQVTQANQTSAEVSQADVAGVPATLAAVVSGSPTLGDGEVVQATALPTKPPTSVATVEAPLATPVTADGPPALEADPLPGQTEPGDATPLAGAPAEDARPTQEMRKDVQAQSENGFGEAAVPLETPAAEPEDDGLTDDQRWLLESLPSLGPAPELQNEVWLNSEPLRLADLLGQVVLLDMWTFG